jgi:hypothetical protein
MLRQSKIVSHLHQKSCAPDIGVNKVTLDPNGFGVEGAARACVGSRHHRSRVRDTLNAYARGCDHRPGAGQSGLLRRREHEFIVGEARRVCAIVDRVPKLTAMAPCNIELTFLSDATCRD